MPEFLESARGRMGLWLVEVGAGGSIRFVRQADDKSRDPGENDRWWQCFFAVLPLNGARVAATRADELIAVAKKRDRI